MTDEDVPQRMCNTCGKFFPETKEFLVTGKKSHNGFRPLCKSCRRASRRTTVPDILPEGYKRCSRCKNPWPATSDYFNARVRSKDGLNEYCKQCRKAEYDEKTHTDIPRPSKWLCEPCNREYPFTEEFFYKNGRMKYGLFTICKRCHVKQGDRRRHKKRYATNDRAREYRKNNRERVLANEARYREKNKERRREQERKRRQEHPERFLANKHRYRQTEHGRMMDRAYCRLRKARLKGVPGSYTAAQITEQLKRQHYRCYYAACGFAKFEKKGGHYVFHIDHTFPVTREGASSDISHLVLACGPCNQSKGNKFPWEWGPGGRLL